MNVTSQAIHELAERTAVLELLTYLDFKVDSNDIIASNNSGTPATLTVKRPSKASGA